MELSWPLVQSQFDVRWTSGEQQNAIQSLSVSFIYLFLEWKTEMETKKESCIKIDLNKWNDCGHWATKPNTLHGLWSLCRNVATPHHLQRGQWRIRSQKIANLNVNLNANSGHVQRSGFGFYIQYDMKMPKKKNVSSAVARVQWRILDTDLHTGYIRRCRTSLDVPSAHCTMLRESTKSTQKMALDLVSILFSSSRLDANHQAAGALFDVFETLFNKCHIFLYF